MERNRALETGRLTEAAREIEKRKRKRRRGASKDRACFTMGVPYGRRVADCSLGEVCRPPLSFVSGPPIQHTACDSQWPAKCASRRSPPLSLVPHRRAAPFLYPRFARPANRVVDSETDAIFRKKKERNAKEEEKKRRKKGKKGSVCVCVREREGGSDTVR